MSGSRIAQPPIVQFADWAPDQGELSTGVAMALNTIRTATGYRPLSSLQVLSKAAIPPPVSGLGMAHGAADDVVTVAAGADGNLYRFERGTLDWTNISQSDGHYQGATMWNFLEFGNRLLAAWDRGKIQSYDMTGAAPGIFQDLSETAPSAKFLALIRDQVFAGYYTDIPAIDRIGWSPIDNIIDWTPNPATLCDFQDNPDCGALMGLVGGAFGVGLFEKLIKRITFVGPPAVYEFDVILNSQGCMVEGSVVGFLNFTFYLSTAGFMMFDGNQVTPIGAEQIDAWFFRDANMGFIDNMRGAADPKNHVVMWVYQGQGDTDGQNGSCVLFNYVLMKWSHGKTWASVVATIATPAYTLDELDTVNTSIDALPASLDSRIWADSLPFLGAMDYNGNLCNFTGPPNQAMIDTRQIMPNGMRRSMLRAIFPLIEGDQTVVYAMVWAKGRPDNIWHDGPILPEGPEGWIPTRREGRYFKIRVLIDGWWTHAVGVEYVASPMGFR